MMHKRKNIEVRPTLLVVEDTPVLQTIYKRYLHYLHYNVIACESGQEALNYFERQTFKAVILDLGLPDMSGEDVLGRIRAQERITHTYTPVIVMTAYNDPARLKRCRQKGADQTFLKPITYQMMEGALNALLMTTPTASLVQESV